MSFQFGKNNGNGAGAGFIFDLDAAMANSSVMPNFQSISRSWSRIWRRRMRTSPTDSTTR